MTQNRSSSTHARAAIARLAQPPRLVDHHPLAARFIHSLRLIAIHDRAHQDPLPELAARLGGLEIAAKSLALAQVVQATWPEDIHISRFCCGLMSHDEATLAAMLSSAIDRDRPAFDHAIAGFIRPDRVHRLWDAVLALVAAEMRAM